MVICVFVWHSEWSWDVVSTCVDFSFEGLAPLRHPSLLGGRAWARQAAGLCRVFLFCCWHNVIESSMFEVSMVWQPDNKMKSFRFENHSLSSPGHILPVTIEVSGGILHWNAQGHKVPREKCHVSISPLELYRKRHWLNRLSSRAQSGTQLLRTKRLHLLILNNVVTKSVELWSCDRTAFEVP